MMCRPPSCDDFVVLRVGLPLVRLVDALVFAPRHAVVVVEVIEVDELLVIDELRLALRQLLGEFVAERLLPGDEFGVAAQQDVGAAARHVRRDRDRCLAARLRDDLGLLRVVLRVQHDVLDAPQLQQVREALRLRDRDGAGQHGSARLLLLDDVGDDRVVLFLLGAIDGVGLLDPLQLAVGRDDHDVELVDLGEFFGLGVGRTRHARELAVLAEVVLEGDGRERLVLALDLDLLLRFHGLMEAVAPPSPRHEAAGELVDDDDRAVLDHVVHVEAEQRVRAQPLLDVVEQRHVHRVVETAAVGRETVGQQLLGPGHPGFRQRHGLVLLVDDEVARLLELFTVFRLDVALDDLAGLERRNDPVHLVIEVGGLFGRPRDDQRRPRLVDQDAVDFVDDGEVMPALHVVREIELHVVAEVIEPELVVRAVGDVGPVGDLPLLVVQLVLDDADAEPQEPIEAAHPLGVAPGEVVVDRDDVHPFARQGVQIRRQRRDEGLAFARLHLGDLAAVQHDAADQLHVEVPHVQHPASALADDREGLGQEVVETLAVGDPRSELGGPVPKLPVGQLRDVRFLGVDFRDDRTKLLQVTLVLRADDLRQNCIDQHQERKPSVNDLTIVTRRRGIQRERSRRGLVNCPLTSTS